MVSRSYKITDTVRTRNFFEHDFPHPSTNTDGGRGIFLLLFAHQAFPLRYVSRMNNLRHALIVYYHAVFILFIRRFHIVLFFSSDGFMPGEQYPESYNSLGKKAFAAGRLEVTGCPDTI